MTLSALFRRAVPFFLVVSFSVSCTSAASPGSQPLATATDAPTLAPASPSPMNTTIGGPLTPEPFLAGFSFPAEIDPTARYMFYLHGRIIEDQGLPAISPEFGEYRYQDILETLQSYGFVVISEQRPYNADSTEYAQRVAAQVNELINAGVPPGSITVVGASKGAAIAMIVSFLLRNAEVNYVFLGACNPPTVDELMQQGVMLFGNVLAIYDFADTYAGSCEELFTFSQADGLGQHAELVVHVGTGHGILYQPLSEWVLPTVQWANQEW